MDTDARFDAKVERVPFSECELWSGGLTVMGYGQFNANGKNMGAHRYQWIRHNGPIPDGLCVLHTCHNGHLGCVSIDHLKLGTRTDNARDREEAGHTPKGDSHYKARLTEADVKEIRRLRAEGGRPVDLAKQFGVASQTICNIAARRIWKHV